MSILNYFLEPPLPTFFFKKRRKKKQSFKEKVDWFCKLMTFENKWLASFWISHPFKLLDVFFLPSWVPYKEYIPYTGTPPPPSTFVSREKNKSSSTGIRQLSNYWWRRQNFWILFKRNHLILSFKHNYFLFLRYFTKEGGVRLDDAGGLKRPFFDDVL